jgi:hypothetical protein
MDRNDMENNCKDLNPSDGMIVNCDEENGGAKLDKGKGENVSSNTTSNWTPQMKRARDRSGSNDFTPTQIHGKIPWIVFQKDLEEDVSTIHGGSRCDGCAESPKSNKSGEDHLNVELGKQQMSPKKQQNVVSVPCSMDCIKSGDRMALLYIFLIGLSESALVVVIAIVIVQL